MEIPTIRIIIGEIFAMFGVLEVWVPNSSRMTPSFLYPLSDQLRIHQQVVYEVSKFTILFRIDECPKKARGFPKSQGFPPHEESPFAP